MITDTPDRAALRYAGEWIAISRGRVIAHGRDFREVAQEACRRAADISIERVPDPNAPVWQSVGDGPAA